MRAVLFCSLPTPRIPGSAPTFIALGCFGCPVVVLRPKILCSLGGGGGVLVRECHASSLAEDGLIVCQQGKKAEQLILDSIQSQPLSPPFPLPQRTGSRMGRKKGIPLIWN